MASRTPTEFNNNWGTDYGIGLGGFFSDIPNGEGLLERGDAGHPTNEGKSGLPGNLSSGGGPGPRLTSSEWELDSEYLDTDTNTPIGNLDLGMDMSPTLDEEMLRTGSVVPTGDALTTDHSWLENAFQDPSRLPHDRWKSLPDLQKLWGNRSTGVVRIDSKDREQVLLDRLKKPLDDDPFNIDKISHQKNIKKLIAGAMRKSASNVPLTQIAKDLFEKSGHDVESIKLAFKAIQAEHGLVGNIYIRASAYPNLNKWGKEIKKTAKTARYLVADPITDQVKQAAQHLGLHVVKSPEDIPWKKEAKLYIPFLEDSGKVIDRTLPPREMLRKAFLSPTKNLRLTTDSIKPLEDTREKLSSQELNIRLKDFKAPKAEGKTHLAQLEEKADKAALSKMGSWVKARLLTKDELTSLLQIKVPPHRIIDKVASVIASRQVGKGQYEGEGVSYKDAGLSLAPSQNHGGVQEVLDNRSKKAALQERKKVFEKIGGLVRANLITEKQAQALKTSNQDYKEILRIAEVLSTKSKMGDYSGHMNEATQRVEVPQDQVRAALDQAQKRAKFKAENEKQARLDKELASKVSLIEKSIQGGMHGQKLAGLISGLLTPDEGERVKHRLNPLLLKYNALGTKKASVAQYQGKTYTEFRGNSAPGKSTEKDISNVVKLASQQMNLGLAGPKLDQALSTTINPAILTASQPQLVQIRKKHEGLAGFAYIDPTAYSTKGIKGCEKGASIHKNTNIPYIMEMSKCGTCIQNVNHSCSKYKKRLITQVPHDDLQGFKTANIKKAQLSQIDEESFFAETGSYVDEYGLETSPDGFSFSFDEKPSTELEEMNLTFGGMVL